ncbi:MAG: PAS domain S-box protein [Methanomicrobiales archaeon]|nr:PAS domain S-box protein [Methanomicrobiales archaeon]
MTVLPTVPAPEKGWLPLILIAVLTLAIFIVSIISLLSGWLTIFQNLFYIPIILACVYYVKRGFIFSVLLACGYFVLMACFSQDFVVLEGAFIRVLIFILVAGVITYLSIVRIRAEEALKESEEFNRGLVENMPNLVLVYDHDRKIRYVNPAATTILGYSAKEMLGTDIITYVVPHQHAEIAVAIQERFSSGRGASLEVEFITKTGQHITVISKGAPLHFNDQPAVLILLADISERKRAEEALVQLSDRLSLATRAGGVGVWDLDLVNNILTWDDQMFALYGIMREQSGGADEAWQAGVHPDDRVRRDAETQMALRGEKEFDTEFRILLPDGSTRNIRALALVQRDTEGMPLRMIGTNWDITGQKKAEEALRESHEKISLLLNSAAEAIYGLDIHGNCTFCNNSCLHLLGYTHQDELLGRNMHWLIHAKQADGTYFPVESCRIFQALRSYARGRRGALAF